VGFQTLYSQGWDRYHKKEEEKKKENRKKKKRDLHKAYIKLEGELKQLGKQVEYDWKLQLLWRVDG